MVSFSCAGMNIAKNSEL